VSLRWAMAAPTRSISPASSSPVRVERNLWERFDSESVGKGQPMGV
jgi:hypothetical protein